MPSRRSSRNSLARRDRNEYSFSNAMTSPADSKARHARAVAVRAAGSRAIAASGEVAAPPARPSQAAIGGRRAAGDKREAIMSAALELFVERGFFGTIVPEIADRAGVGAGTIYRYFDSKEALVNAIYREQKLLFGRIAVEEFPVTAPTREQFRVLWTRMAKFATENPSSFGFLELHHHAQYLDAESRAVEQRISALFANVVIRAQARGELKQGDPRILMGLVMGAFIGVIRNCGDGPLDETRWVLAEQCMWEAIRA
jgi:TetR/AcrR family transcriptional regulator, repressor of fatR-cypB operon